MEPSRIAAIQMRLKRIKNYQGKPMKDTREILQQIISKETRYIESMALTLKEDERTILRLQNKASCLQKEIEERKQSIEEYRKYLKNGSDRPSASIRLIPSMQQSLDTRSSAN